MTSILLEKIKPTEKEKFCKLSLSCGIEWINQFGYSVQIYDPLIKDNKWFFSWIYGYNIHHGEIDIIKLNKGNRCHQNIISQPLTRDFNVDVRTMFYILSERIIKMKRITGFTLGYQKAREFSLLYMKERLEDLNQYRKYLLLMMYARVMGLAAGPMKLKIKERNNITLQDHFSELDEQIIGYLPKIEEFVTKAVLRLNYDVLSL